ncbi:MULTISPECIES: L,D-transpeptidase family protein [Bradyrhizobium]|uniref:L,D-transpeptidase family protein n=1 Tax=Bradyrhizobium elkanii TaxID=29448 RepID=UPI000687FA10|nr:L,D-transpeptidase family protein [Bradyrhizobium elkanii]
MISRFVRRQRKQTRRQPAYLIIAAFAALIAAGDPADARGARSERSVESVQSRIAGEPMMAVVSLQDQRITVYDANGWILRAPVSSGQRGRETPAGIFSIIQKEAEHYSNLYDDAYMPHMQRITWSGIALHGGPLPGYAASHGCVRMPFDFAARLFEDTRIGLRVIVAPTDVAPIEIAHPALLQPKPGAIASAAARRAEADEAAAKADQARRAAAKAYRESTQASMPVRVADNLKRRAETQLAAAEAALGSAASPEAKEQAERTKAQAVTRVAELQEQWTAAKAELQPKLDAVAAAREAALAAENARIAAVDAARQAARELEPVSVLISRKTQRLYVRRAFEPILDSPVTIQDPDRPIGTHVFTAMEPTDGGNGIRWSVVSLESSHPHGGAAEPHDPARGHRAREVEPKKTEPASAMAALDRIVIPQDVMDRIAGITPRSSLIITDEGLSSETSKGTEFVVLMSGEPQGGIKMRRRAPASEYPYARARDRQLFWGRPFAGPFSTW